MFETFKTSINEWNVQKSERQKLQHCYLGLAAAITLVAGIVSLFDAQLGHKTEQFALVAIGTFLVNAIAWNLLKGSLLEKLPSKPRRR